MRQKLMMAALVALGVSVVGGTVVRAAVITTLSLKDLNDGTEYRDADISKQYAGNGYLGLYQVEDNYYNSFGHLFGVEETGFSRTALQADIRMLHGMTVTRATLSFDLLDGTPGIQQAQVGTFRTDGNLGWAWDPALSGSALYDVGLGSNALDITGLVQARVDNGEEWIGLHLTGSGLNQWTYTGASQAGGDDRANVRLTFEYIPSGVIPEPSGALAGAGVVGAGLLRRRR